MPAAGHSVKNTVTAPECAELHKMTDMREKKKVEGVNGKQFLSLIGLHFSAIFVSTGSQNFVTFSGPLSLL